jgi:transposase
MRKNKKHDFDFRLSVVREVIKGKHSPGSISQEKGIHESMVERWVSFYKMYGVDGIKPIRNNYSTDFRLKVIGIMKAESLSLNQTCLRYKIPSVSTLRNWLMIYDALGAQGLSKITKGKPTIMPRKPKKPLTREEQLLEELADLRAENAYLKKLHALIQSEEKKDEKRKSSKN